MDQQLPPGKAQGPRWHPSVSISCARYVYMRVGRAAGSEGCWCALDVCHEVWYLAVYGWFLRRVCTTLDGLFEKFPWELCKCFQLKRCYRLSIYPASIPKRWVCLLRCLSVMPRKMVGFLRRYG